MGDTFFSVAFSIILTVLVGSLIGFAEGFLITKGKIPAFVVTLGGMAIFRSLVLNFANGGVYMSLSTKYSSIGLSTIFHLPVPMLVYFLYVILAWFILDKTRFGRYVFAVGANEIAATYSAISVHKIRIWTYVISGISVSISAIMLSSMMGSVSSSSTGNGFELDAIAAAVIGGTSLSGGKGSIWGTFLGALVLGVINNMLVMLNVAVYLQGLVKGLIIISAVFLQNLKNE
ncbi:MAG: ABC transporter permease [Fervidobacterium sp.]